MNYLYKFNEEFNWGKLNIFSNKKKEELKVEEDDEALAQAIYSAISDKVRGEIKGGDISGLSFNYDGDVFISWIDGFIVNGQRLYCSKETYKKFYNLFKSKKEEFRKLQSDSIKDKLKSKYK